MGNCNWQRCTPSVIVHVCCLLFWGLVSARALGTVGACCLQDGFSGYELSCCSGALVLRTLLSRKYRMDVEAELGFGMVWTGSL